MIIPKLAIYYRILIFRIIIIFYGDGDDDDVPFLYFQFIFYLISISKEHQIYLFSNLIFIFSKKNVQDSLYVKICVYAFKNVAKKVVWELFLILQQVYVFNEFVQVIVAIGCCIFLLLIQIFSCPALVFIFHLSFVLLFCLLIPTQKHLTDSFCFILLY